MVKFTVLLFLIFLNISCAGNQPKPVVNPENASLEISPQQAQLDLDTAKRSNPLIWGGVIVHLANLEEYTQLEILAYPLSENLRPDTSLTPVGRFILHHPGYLEGIDYSAGRELTVLGTVTHLVNQKIDEASYDFPQLLGKELHLWPRQRQNPEPRFNFGFGVILSN